MHRYHSLVDLDSLGKNKATNKTQEMLRGRSYFQQKTIWDHPNENRSDGTFALRYLPREYVVGNGAQKRGHGKSQIFDNHLQRGDDEAIGAWRGEWRKKQRVKDGEVTAPIGHSTPSFATGSRPIPRNYRKLNPREPFKITMGLTLPQLCRWEKLKPREKMEFVKGHTMKVSVRGRIKTQTNFQSITLSLMLLYPLILQTVLSHPK